MAICSYWDAKHNHFLAGNGVEDKEETPSSHPLAHQAVSSIAQDVPDLSRKDQRTKVPPPLQLPFYSALRTLLQISLITASGVQKTSTGSAGPR